MKNPMQPLTAAGKPSKPRGNQERLGVAAIATALLFIALFGGFASSAQAEGPPAPGWELSAYTNPSNLAAGIDEEQGVSVTGAVAGTFTLSFEGSETGAIPFNAPAKVSEGAESVEAALQSLPGIGKGNVSVSKEGAGDPYLITFTGMLGDMKLSELSVNAGGLNGPEPGASVSQKTLGAASGTIVVDVFNVGAGNASGPITFTDTLPKGITAREAGVLGKPSAGAGEEWGVNPEIRRELWECTGNGPGVAPAVLGATVVTCTLDPSVLPSRAESVFAGGGGLPTARPNGTTNHPNLQPPVAISVAVEKGAKEGTKAGVEGNHATIAGGGAPASASTTDPLTVSQAPAAPGFTHWDAWFSNADGTLDTQAGSHPYEATFAFNFASALNSKRNGYLPGGEARDLEVRLPPGFVGDPLAVPQCVHAQLYAETCPAGSQVGVVGTASISGLGITRQVYNSVPPPGVAAEFGFMFEGILVTLDSTVRTGGDYGITTHVDDIPQRVTVASVLTLWGVPGEASHDLWRCGAAGGCQGPGPTAGTPAREFLTLPTACEAPQPFSIGVSSGWQEPDANYSTSFNSHNAEDEELGFTGCDDLAFGPSIATKADTAKADTPAGLTVEVTPPIGGLEEPGQLGTSDIKNTTVKLPVGFVINPGQAVGLQACPEGPADTVPGQEQYGDNLPLPGPNAVAEGESEKFYGPAFCPTASKVGTVKIKSPLIEQAAEKEFEGNVYVLQSNPPELKLLVAAGADGVNLKLVGEVHLCETTGEVIAGTGEVAERTCEAPGQVITTFKGTPELPASLFKLSFSGGPQAALDTPSTCGTYTTTSDFTSWSSPFIGDAFPTAQFATSEGPGGGACTPYGSPLPFHPELIAGATTDIAGAFTNFSLLLQRGDGQQRIEKLQFTAPEGLTGFLSNVTLCTNAQAETNTCPSTSQIGHTVVESGPGPYPLVVPEPGQEPAPIYLTESYGGAPFGLSVVVPLKVGPFTLPTQRVRAKIAVNPITSQLTVTTNPLPQVVAGVPTDVREVDAVIERPDFMVNPTSCEPKQFSGIASGAPPPGSAGAGVQAPISSHFKSEACGALHFEPKFSVSTSGKTSKSQGASLTAKVSYPSGPQGTYADVGKVKVELPKQLPSRLTTLQKACTNAQFEANPAACPAASKIGYATVHTPLLPVPLQGPAIFVSHGGEAFPSLTMVLQGDGVTVDLVGTTFISKAGITSTTFKAVPDDPFSTFELTLPEGPYSALAANGNLCDQKLTMPTEFKAQNGAEIKQDTKIAVTGCPSNISIESKNVSGKKTTLTVYVPAAGKLTASGKGLTSERKTYSGQEAQTFTLTQKKAGKLKTKIKLTFTPSKGKKQTKSLTVRFTR